MDSTLRSNANSQGKEALHATDIGVLRTWRQALAILIAAWFLVLYIFSDTVFFVLDQWIENDTYSYCFMVLPIAIYLIWDQRTRLISLVPRPNNWGLPILATIGVIWLLGQVGAVLVVQGMALVAVLQVLVFTVFGWPVTRVILYPLGALIFAAPFGGEWVRPLQDFTAFFAVKALQLTGVPVFKDGWIIATPSQTWVIVEACSGVRYVNAFVFLGYLFSYWNYRSWTRRLAFVLVCFFGGIVANGVRTYATIMVAHSVGVNHLVQGWILFFIVVLITFCIGLLWREPAVADPKQGPIAVMSKDGPIDARSSKAMALTALGAVLLLGLAPLAAQNVLRPQAMLSPAVIPTPRAARPWRALDEHVGNWKPHFVGAEAELSKSYMAEGRRVQMYIAYFRGSQRQGEELISAGNDLMPEKNWRPVSAGTAQAVIDGESVSVDQIVLRSNDRTRLLWSWYWVGGKSTSNAFFGKLLEIKSLLLREQKGSAMIALAVDVENGNHREAAETLGNFLRHVAIVQALKEQKSD